MSFEQTDRRTGPGSSETGDYHITVASPTGARSWQFRISRRKAFAGLVFSGVISLVAIAGILSTGLLVTRLAAVQALEAENIQLRRQLTRVGELEYRIAELDASRRSLMEVLGVRTAEEMESEEALTEIPLSGGESYMRVEPLGSVGDAALVEIRGALDWVPLEGPLTRAFGTLRQSDIFHTGLDIAGDSHSPVLAAGVGVVSSIGWDETLGWVLVIAHSPRLKTVYGHNSRILARVGDSVASGQTVAEVGSTGLSSAPHLHFEIHWQGKAIDPLLVYPTLDRQPADGGPTDVDYSEAPEG